MRRTTKRRHIRLRKRISGNLLRPRLSVYRSNKGLYVQAIDDENSKTIVGISDSKIRKEKNVNKLKKNECGYELGIQVGKELVKLKIDTVVFDRGGNKYHGRVKAVAEGLRNSGLKF